MKRATRHVAVAVVAALALAAGGCGKDEAEVVDLNKVLEIFDQVAKSEMPGQAADAADAADAGDGAGTGEQADVAPVRQGNPELTQAFLKAFADELNKARLISKPIGVRMAQKGEIQGFQDNDKDMRKDSREPELFSILIDSEGNRIIAKQTVAGQTYRRDRHYYGYRRHYWGPYIYGRMWYERDDYYHRRGRRVPDYSRTRMSSKSYHTTAVSRASRARSSARSGGSRSFRGGK